MRQLAEVMNSGELQSVYLGGTEVENETVVRGDFEPAINAVSQDIDPLSGYASPEDRMLVHDTSDMQLKSAYMSQIPWVFEIVTVASNLGPVLSKAEFDAAIPSPALGRPYLILDSNGNAFHCTWDGTDAWFERMAKCA